MGAYVGRGEMTPSPLQIGLNAETIDFSRSHFVYPNTRSIDQSNPDPENRLLQVDVTSTDFASGPHSPQSAIKIYLIWP